MKLSDVGVIAACFEIKYRLTIQCFFGRANQISGADFSQNDWSIDVLVVRKIQIIILDKNN